MFKNHSQSWEDPQHLIFEKTRLNNLKLIPVIEEIHKIYEAVYRSTRCRNKVPLTTALSLQKDIKKDLKWADRFLYEASYCLRRRLGQLDDPNILPECPTNSARDIAQPEVAECKLH